MAELATSMVLSAFAGKGAACVCHPLDVIRVQMQVSATPGASVVSTAKDIVAAKGPGGLYTGLTAAFLRQWMYGSGRMGIYSYLFQKYKADNPGVAMPMALKLGYGALSAGTGAFIGTPSEVAIVRMAADSQKPEAERRNYKHVIDCLGKVVKEEGAANLYKGASVTVLRAASLGSFQLGFYSEAKEALVARGWASNSILTQFCSAMFASVFANGASLPFDVVKSRIQNADPKNPAYTGMLDCAKKSIAAEGPLVLWKGFTPAFVKLAPYSVISLSLLETLTMWWTGKAAM